MKDSKPYHLTTHNCYEICIGIADAINDPLTMAVSPGPIPSGAFGLNISRGAKVLLLKNFSE